MNELGSFVRKEIAKKFEQKFNDSQIITKLYKSIKDRKASEKEAYEFAKEVSRITNELFNTYFNNEDYSQKEAYDELANEIVIPMLEKNYGVISSYNYDIHKIKYENLDLGLNPITPKFDTNRAEGLLTVATESPTYNEVKESFGQKIENFNYHIVDESIKENAEFMAGSGITTTITRTTFGKTCKWCQNLAGTYTYPGVDSEVFARHDNCDCTIKVSHYKKPSYYMRTSGNAFVRSS